MAVTVSCTAVIEEANRVLVNFSDGVQREFPNKAAVMDYIAGIDTDPELARRFGIARWAHNNPTLANPQNLVGHSCTIDVAATPMVSVA